MAAPNLQFIMAAILKRRGKVLESTRRIHALPHGSSILRLTLSLDHHWRADCRFQADLARLKVRKAKGTVNHWIVLSSHFPKVDGSNGGVTRLVKERGRTERGLRWAFSWRLRFFHQKWSPLRGSKRLEEEKLQLQKRRQERRRPTRRWKKCNPVRKKKRQL